MPVHFSMRIALLSLFWFVNCTGFNLEGKIASALKPALSSAIFLEIAVSNKGISRDLPSYTGGGSAPYTYSLTVNGTLPSYLEAGISGGSFYVRRNTSVLMPTTVTGTIAMPEMTITVSDSTGASANLKGTPSVYVKRVFVASDVIGFDSTTWHNGSMYDYSACTSGDPVEKANCRCRATARGRAMPGADKYRAWLSSNAIDAACNLTSIAGKSCTPEQYAGGPWYNMNNNLVAEDIGAGTTRGLLAVNDSTNQALQSAIQYYETGGNAGAATVWGGTNTTGLQAAGTDCTNWTSGGGTIRYGRVDGINSGGVASAPFWNGGSQACTATPTMGFYCFQGD
ncbi:MAG: hypothetical protein JNJ69_02720 [Leptospiraceae bacterium]|nr:hypothetical protein [Leptospiraceae bacterium]